MHRRRIESRAASLPFSQVLELGLPTVVAVNMLDVAASRGIKLELRHLQNRLGVPVVPIQANRGKGIEEIKAALLEALEPRLAVRFFALSRSLRERDPRPADAPGDQGLPSSPCRRTGCGHRGGPCRASGRNVPEPSNWPSRRSSAASVAAAGAGAAAAPGRERLLSKHAVAQCRRTVSRSPAIRPRQRVEAGGCPIPAIETTVRYAWARSMLQGVVTEPKEFRTDGQRSHRSAAHAQGAGADRLRAADAHGLPIGLRLGAAADGRHRRRLRRAGRLGRIADAEGALQSLVVNGVIGGVGGVLQFLPQILILFTFIALLEDCGYMARAAYLMDRIMVRAGLSGRSFIPMLSSFACAVPGIMAARVIENERDRLTTILVAPLLTCSARLPVYALLIAAFVPPTTYPGRLARPARADARRRFTCWASWPR